jgi:hypothetical protein
MHSLRDRLHQLADDAVGDVAVPEFTPPTARSRLPVVVGGAILAAGIGIGVILGTGGASRTQVGALDHPNGSATSLPAHPPTSATNTTPAPSTPQVSVTPKSGPIGTHITVVGKGFASLVADMVPRDSPINVYLHQYAANGNDVLIGLGQVKVSADGSFTLSAVIPPMAGLRQAGPIPTPIGKYQFVVGPTANILSAPIFTVMAR